MSTFPAFCTTLDDRALLATAKRLAMAERHATAALLRALAEIDTRRLYLGDGCASLFVYCTRVLHLSEGGAYNRIEAARAARAYPLILELFEQAAITLTAVRLLAPHLTRENHVTVLASARHQTKREVEALVAALAPKPDAPTVVRRLPAQPAGESRPLAIAPARQGPDTEPMIPVDGPAATPLAPPGPVRLAPLAPDRYRIQVTVSRETHDRFRRAQALLRHAIPTGDAAEILDRALTLLVEQLERRRFAQTSRLGGASARAAGSRYIPAFVRRTVWRRDEGQCTFVGREGRCGETAFLEFHHVDPYALGGPPTAENIALRCRAHNQHEAAVCFGSRPPLAKEPRAAYGCLHSA